jgi:hypothetical protein
LYQALTNLLLTCSVMFARRQLSTAVSPLRSTRTAVKSNPHDSTLLYAHRNIVRSFNERITGNHFHHRAEWEDFEGRYGLPDFFGPMTFPLMKKTCMPATYLPPSFHKTVIEHVWKAVDGCQEPLTSRQWFAARTHTFKLVRCLICSLLRDALRTRCSFSWI